MRGSRGWRGLLRGAAMGLGMLALLSAGCDNNPWPEGSAATNTLFTAAQESSPRHLDPTASYWNNDTPFTYQIYEPPYGYHYLKRPFQLVPKAAERVVEPRFLDKDGHELPADAPAEQVAESVYDVPIRRGVMFQPHPAFAVDAQGRHRYHALDRAALGERRTPLEFEHQGTRELVAEDFVYAIKRQATTRITAPIYSLFAEYVLGLREYGALIRAEDAKLLAGLPKSSLDKPMLDFRRWPLAGATAPEKHLLRIRLKGKYPQWSYWMSLTFLAPVPWEADAFYANPGFAERGLSLDTWPVGTGPYMMVEYEKDRRHVMARNPHYRGEPYPCEGMPGDKEAGLLDDCGKTMPFIDRIVTTVEREAVPQRGKFRQGFYDVEVFERTDTGMDYLVAMQDSEDVRREYTAKGFRLGKGSDVNSYYLGFNMLDPVLGDGEPGLLSDAQREKNRKLRQAISIAIDWEEWSRIFPKEAGDTAMGPIPPGIFGSRELTPEGVNPVTHRVVDGRVQRRPIADAKRLMAEAGYANGRDEKTGRPLVLNYDYYSAPTPGNKPKLDWMVRQFAKIDIQLEVRATDNNQFQDKVRKGQYQVFWLGWLADYPDPENFLFLLYGPTGKTKHDGENTANYLNPEFDRLYQQMKTQPDGPERQALVDRMVALVQNDAPWSFGFFPYTSGAAQRWVHNYHPAILIRDHGRYLRLDVPDRVAALAAWNRPVWWPLLPIAGVLLGLLALARAQFRRRERMTARGKVLA
jgi:ABC-type transport system substrate-binding protein